MGPGAEPAWDPLVLPHCLGGQGSATDWVVQLAYGDDRHKQNYSPPSAPLPVAICPFWVDYDTKTFLILIQPLP